MTRRRELRFVACGTSKESSDESGTGAPFGAGVDEPTESIDETRSAADEEAAAETAEGALGAKRLGPPTVGEGCLKLLMLLYTVPATCGVEMGLSDIGLTCRRAFRLSGLMEALRGAAWAESAASSELSSSCSALEPLAAAAGSLARLSAPAAPPLSLGNGRLADEAAGAAAGGADPGGAATPFQSLTSCEAASLMGADGSLRSLLTVLPTPLDCSDSMDIGILESTSSSCSVFLSSLLDEARASHSSSLASAAECEKSCSSGFGVALSASTTTSSAPGVVSTASSLMRVMSVAI